MLTVKSLSAIVFLTIVASYLVATPQFWARF